MKDPYRIVGSVLAGKYELLEFAGGGGMGAVYRALNVKSRNTVAVKILKPDIAARNPEYADLFEREVETAKALRYPHIAQVFDGGRDDDLSFMVMEWIEGTPLEEVISQRRLPLESVTTIFGQICGAVAFAHKRNIIHLDLKPANVLLLAEDRPNEIVKVIDFGLSRVLSRESGTTVTRFRGTYQYCAPEQFGGKVSYRSDIYSLGATLYHLLTGVVPFGTSYINAKMNDLALPVVPSVARQAGLPPALDYVIRKALDKDPRRRQQSVTQLFEEFDKAARRVAPQEEEAGVGAPAAARSSPPPAAGGPELRITERQAGAVTILDMEGKITIGEGSVTFRDAIRRLTEAGIRNILLNVSDIVYVDSSGIGELFSALTVMSRLKGKLKLLRPTQKLRDLLTITKIIDSFDVYEDEAVALDSFR